MRTGFSTLFYNARFPWCDLRFHVRLHLRFRNCDAPRAAHCRKTVVEAALCHSCEFASKSAPCEETLLAPQRSRHIQKHSVFVVFYKANECAWLLEGSGAALYSRCRDAAPYRRTMVFAPCCGSLTPDNVGTVGGGVTLRDTTRHNH